MFQLVRSLTSLGATALLIGGLVAGCGQQAPQLGAAAARQSALRAKNAPYAQPLRPRPMSRPMRATLTKQVIPTMRMMASGPNFAALEGDDEPAGDADAPPAPAAPAAGAGGPLTRPTPTPAPGKPGAGRAPDEIDDFLDALQNYGYRGDRRHLIAAVHDVVYQYPINSEATPGGWESAEVSRKHFAWWAKSLRPDETGSYDDYVKQSLLVAQNKFNVVYYVWVSKQVDPEEQRRTGGTSPWVDFNKELPIVKGIGRGPWLTQIDNRGLIVDFLRMPEHYIDPLDWNHLIKIPEDLYY